MINVTDAGGTIEVQFTVAYTANGVTTSPIIYYFNKSTVDIASEGNDVIIQDEVKYFAIPYIDITTPVGNSAAEIAALIQAFITSGGGGSYMPFAISTKGVIAHAGGGQANATAMATLANGFSYVRVDECASNNDSVKPSTTVLTHMQMTILNRNAIGKSMRMFPFPGDRFLSVDSGLMAVNAPIDIADGNQLSFYCYEDGVMTIE